MVTTPHLLLPILVENASDLHTDINRAFYKLDNTSHLKINGRLQDPPDLDLSQLGKLYIVEASPTGVWAGHEDDIAYSVFSGFDDVTEWRYIVPTEGLKALVYFNTNDACWEYWDGNNWFVLFTRTYNGHILHPDNNADEDQAGDTHSYSINSDCISPYIITEFSVQIDDSTTPTNAECDVQLRIESSDYTPSLLTGPVLDDYALHTVSLSKEVLSGQTLRIKINNFSTYPPQNIRFSVHVKMLART